jgi:hypothetical protein
MQTLTVRKAALAALVPLTLGSLTACGSGDSSSSAGGQPGTPTGSSTHSTGDQGSTTIAGSTVSSVDFVKLMQSAAAKLTTVKVQMTGATSGQSYMMKGAMDLTGKKPAMDMTMSMASSGLSGIEMRLVDGTIYLSLGSMTQGKFVKFDLNDPNNPLGSLSSSLNQLDPAQMMGQLSPDAFRHVTYVGSDASGRHYHATLITSKAPQLKGLPSSATADLPKTASYDTWLDSQGRFSKFVVTVPKVMKMTADYTDYGSAVHISAPPSSQITKIPGSNASL